MGNKNNKAKDTVSADGRKAAGDSSFRKEAFQLMMQMMKGEKFPDLGDSVQDSIGHIKKMAKDDGGELLKDSYGNSLTAIGTEDKVQTFTNYGFSNDTLNWMLWLALYNDSWVFRRAIDKPAQDEVRCGITLLGNSDFSDVYEELKKYYTDLINLLQWGALFGGAVAVMMFDNLKDEDYRNPLREHTIKAAKAMRLYVTDRWYGVSQHGSEMVTDMQSPDFGKPKYYDITLANGSTIVCHYSFVLRYEHRTAPKLIKTGWLQGWGYAEGSHILNEIARDDQFKAAIQSLVNKALIEVIKMSGMRGVFMGADADNEEQLMKRLEMVNWGRTYNSLTFLDKDDEYQEHSFSGLTGLSDLLEQNMWLVSAALDMQGILYGDLKNGFSTDTNAMERYDETINGRCENYYRPVLTKLLKVLYIKCGISEKIDYAFNSLLSKQRDKEKMEAISNYCDMLSKLLADGVITAKIYAKSLQQYLATGVVSLPMTDEEIEELDDKMAEEAEGIMEEEPDGGEREKGPAIQG